MIKKILILIIFSIYNIKSYEYPKSISGYFGQKGQDKYLNEKIFKNKTHGTFIEIGAHDGISFSNTYFFEKYLNWSGICVEPNPDIFEKLKKNRRCHCEQSCITNVTGKKTFLKCTGYMIEMYSGLIDYYDPRHINRIDQEIDLYGGNKETLLVDCITFQDLVAKYNMEYIDLLSIDIEGGEEVIIKEIDFTKIKINVIVVENNFNETAIRQFLLSKGYKYITQVGKDDIYQLEEMNIKPKSINNKN